MRREEGELMKGLKKTGLVSSNNTHEGRERRGETDSKGQVGQKLVKQVIGRQAEKPSNGRQTYKVKVSRGEKGRRKTRQETEADRWRRW